MIGIVGAGPGGLTAALALRAVGFEVEVLEQSEEVRAVGAGITLQVNAMRMLAAIGQAERLLARGRVLDQGFIARPDGVPLSAVMGMGDWGVPGIGIDRGTLARTLVEALPPGTVRCGARVEGVDPSGCVRLRGGEERAYEAVIGADGIHSAVRRSVLGEVRLRYSGTTCWRGLASVPAPHFCERWGRGLRFGTVPLPGDRTYWFACANAPEGERDGDDVHRELLDRFAHFEPAVREQIRAADVVMRHDLYDLPDLPRWTHGRVTLLGDAAHAMTPNMGQGAGQSIEDAVVLADAVAHHGVPDGLAVYEARRRDRARRFVDRSWRFGQVAQWEHPVACWARDLAMRCTPSWTMRRQLEEVYGVAVPAL